MTSGPVYDVAGLLDAFHAAHSPPSWPAVPPASAGPPSADPGVAVGARRAGGAAADDGLWARLAALEGRILDVGNHQRFVVVAVTASGVYVRQNRTRPAFLLDRRALREAFPYVAAGEPLPRPFRGKAARLTAVLRAAGVGPGP